MHRLGDMPQLNLMISKVAGFKTHDLTAKVVGCDVCEDAFAELLRSLAFLLLSF